MVKHTPRWSIIVPTVAGWSGSLGRAYPGLRAAAALARGEIVVVFDTPVPEPPPGTACEVTVVATGGNRGYAGACNEGARHAHGSMLLFVNDDVFVEASLLRGLEEHWPSDDRVGAVVPDVWSERLRRSEAGCFVQSRFGILDTRQEDLAGRTHIDYPCGAAVAIERRTLDRAGGWEELYAPGYWEDESFPCRLSFVTLEHQLFEARRLPSGPQRASPVGAPLSWQPSTPGHNEDRQRQRGN